MKWEPDGRRTAKELLRDPGEIDAPEVMRVEFESFNLFRTFHYLGDINIQCPKWVDIDISCHVEERDEARASQPNSTHFIPSKSAPQVSISLHTRLPTRNPVHSKKHIPSDPLTSLKHQMIG